MLEKLLNNMKMLVQLVLLHNFLHNHMRYIYRQIYNLKGKKFCLNKISFFLFYKLQSKALCLLCSRHIGSVGCGSEETLPSRCQVRFTPRCVLCLEQHTQVGSPTERIPWSSVLRFFFSFIFIIFVFLSIRQGCTGPDLPVAVKPLLHHLRDQGVTPPPSALLHGHENAPLRHTAVQPLPEQLLLLLLVTQL